MPTPVAAPLPLQVASAVQTNVYMQPRDVWCYVILCNKTIDERIFESLKDKRTLAEIALEELK
jgi:hypothetical protein